MRRHFFRHKRLEQNACRSVRERSARQRHRICSNMRQACWSRAERRVCGAAEAFAPLHENRDRWCLGPDRYEIGLQLDCRKWGLRKRGLPARANGQACLKPKLLAEHRRYECVQSANVDCRLSSQPANFLLDKAGTGTGRPDLADGRCEYTAG